MRWRQSLLTKLTKLLTSFKFTQIQTLVRGKVLKHGISLLRLISHDGRIIVIGLYNAVPAQMPVAAFLGYDIRAENHRQCQRSVSQAIAKRRVNESSPNGSSPALFNPLHHAGIESRAGLHVLGGFQ